MAGKEDGTSDVVEGVTVRETVTIVPAILLVRFITIARKSPQRDGRLKLGYIYLKISILLQL